MKYLITSSFTNGVLYYTENFTFTIKNLKLLHVILQFLKNVLLIAFLWDIGQCSSVGLLWLTNEKEK